MIVCTRKARVLDVVYNASNNELVRTKTLVKGCIIQIDATPFKQWYESHYGVKVGGKRAAKRALTSEGEVVPVEKQSNHLKRTIEKRAKGRTLDPILDDSFGSVRLLACVSSRPGQSGRCDGYILEGKELEFYVKMLKRAKGK